MNTDQLAQAVTLRVPGLQSSIALFVHRENDLHVSRQIREEGIWEPYESSLVLDLLQSGDVFVDVGANVGYFSILAASVVGTRGQVFAFEPDPTNFHLLQCSVKANGFGATVRAKCAGLATEAGAARLYLSEDNLGDHQIFDAGGGRESVSIELLNGTDYLTGRLSRIDLLKLDTQGSEQEVIAGLMPLLLRLDQAPRLIVELTPLSLRQCGSSGRQLIELLAQLQLPFWIIDHIEHRLVASSVEELADWCDAVDAVSGDEGFMNILVGSAPDSWTY